MSGNAAKTEPHIRVHGLVKSYRLYPSISARLKQLFARDGARHYVPLFALKGISFDIAPGEAFGVIGRNGSGKSTLLQIIAGTLAPTEGSVDVNGSVGALLELGSGFHPEFTGRENTYLYGAILGLSRATIASQLKYIQDFADLGENFDRPIKTYSSGMLLRLGFSIQACLDSDIFIVDEILSVGDYFFQQKCLSKLRELRDRGATLVLATHDLSIVRDFCNRAMVLRGGECAFVGDSLSAIKMYVGSSASRTSVSAAPTLPEYAPTLLSEVRRAAHWSAPIDRIDSHARILAVGGFDARNHPALDVSLGERLYVRVLFRAGESSRRLHVAIAVKNRWGQVINSTSSRTLGMAPVAMEVGGEALFELALDMNLEAGGYSFRATLVGCNDGEYVTLDETPWLGPIQVEWQYGVRTPPFHGMFGIPAAGRFVTE